ncbi:hypothetical protein QTP88_027554 [Uroleucon formosanum]
MSVTSVENKSKFNRIDPTTRKAAAGAGAAAAGAGAAAATAGATLQSRGSWRVVVIRTRTHATAADAHAHHTRTGVVVYTAGDAHKRTPCTAIEFEVRVRHPVDQYRRHDFKECCIPSALETGREPINSSVHISWLTEDPSLANCDFNTVAQGFSFRISWNISEVEIIFPSAELSQNCCGITSASSGDIAGPALRRRSSMSNIAVQMSSAGDADHNLQESDVEFPFVALMQKPMTIDTQPANDSAQTVLVKPSVSSTSDSSPSVSLSSVSSPQQSNRDFEDLLRWRGDIKHVPSRDVIESSVLENLCTTAQVQTANLLQDLSEVRRCDAIESITETASKPKSRSIGRWTKRFVRRLFCCA